MTTPLPRPRYLPLDLWPALHRAAWERGFAPHNPFRTRTPALPPWRPATILKYRQGYSVWLAFLMAQADWDPAAAPATWVTVVRLRRYYWFLHDAGNRPQTITGQFDGLTQALRVLAPEGDWGWVRRPDGQAIRTLRPQTPRPRPLPPDTAVLADWACAMMDAARAEPDGPAAWLRYRDGLFIAMLAWRARRLRSMALLRPGHELLRRGDRYRIELTAGQVKTHKPDRFDLPEALTGYIQHYLARVRPALLAGRPAEALWVGRHGRPLSAKSLADRVFKATTQRFGRGFGPHRFRHALSTTATLSAAARPGMAAALLDISAPVIERHYDLSGQVAVTGQFARQIAAKRRHYATQASGRESK